MPYCVQCGNQVHDTDVYCGRCGSRQRDAAGSGPAEEPRPSGPTTGFPGATTDPFHNIPPRTASILCYIPVVGWVPAIIVLASSRFRTDRVTRFHAWQGLYLFVAWLLVEWVITPVFRHVPGPHVVDNLAKAVILVAWIFMLVKTSQEQVFHLPVIGELAERSVAEQR